MSKALAVAAVALGARVLYRVHEGHHTVEQVQATDDKGVKLFDDETYERDGDGARMVRQAPRMRTVSEGSVHHPAMREFVAIVGAARTDADEKSPTHGETVYDLLLLVPNGAPKWIDGVAQGDSEHHTFSVLDGDEVDHETLAAQVTSLTDQVANLQTALANIAAAKA